MAALINNLFLKLAALIVNNSRKNSRFKYKQVGAKFAKKMLIIFWN